MQTFGTLHLLSRSNLLEGKKTVLHSNQINIVTCMYFYNYSKYSVHQICCYYSQLTNPGMVPLGQLLCLVFHYSTIPKEISCPDLLFSDTQHGLQINNNARRNTLKRAVIKIYKNPQ